MRETRIIMGMPITVEIVDDGASEMIKKVFEYFEWVDATFSTYKENSEISLINAGKLSVENASEQVRKVLALCEKTKQETDGFFDILRDGKIDPSGIVKGWAIWNAGKMCEEKDFKNFYVEAGGDAQVMGRNGKGKLWRVGIRNPFQVDQIVKVVELPRMGKAGWINGIATSGTYERGSHIYNPTEEHVDLSEVVSLTVIGPNVYEADRFATAAFAMGRTGIEFIEQLPGLEGYQIDRNGQAIMTSGFEKFVSN